MRYLKRILYLLIVFVMFIPLVYADTDKGNNLVNIYLFYSDSCIHCASEKEVLNEMLDNYENVRLYKYEVSKNDDNRKLMMEIADLVGVDVSGVPFTIVADKPYKGFDRNSSKRVFLGTIEYYSNHGYRDIVGEYLGGIGLPAYEITDNSDFYDYIDNYGNHIISFLGFKIDTKDLTLPMVSIILGIVNGFNSSTIWVVLFFISMLIIIKDKKRMWLLGLIFLSVLTLGHLLLMIFSMKIPFVLIGIVRVILGLISIILAIISIGRCIRNEKKLDSNMTKIFSKIENNFLSIVGIIVLAILVNIVGFLYFNDFSLIFLEILSIHNLSMIEEFIYIFIYVLFFLLDDFIIFFIVMMVSVNGFFIKHRNLFNGISVIFLLLIGILLLFKPEWLMFNF